MSRGSYNKKKGRWYMRIFCHFLEIAILNAYIIYTRVCAKENAKPMDRYSFHLQLARELIAPLRKHNNNPTTPPNTRKKRKSEFCLEQLLKKVKQLHLSKKSYQPRHNLDVQYAIQKENKGLTALSNAKLMMRVYIRNASIVM